MCQRRGIGSGDPAMRSDWMDLAGEWRRLSNDGDAQGTMARLMQGPLSAI